MNIFEAVISKYIWPDSLSRNAKAFLNMRMMLLNMTYLIEKSFCKLYVYLETVVTLEGWS